ncbi:surface anchored protein [Streptococcus pneumoniae]|nr:surface anchored protein [Streptococcus pneumoniae]
MDKSLAESAQTSLQALLANLTLDSMKELHARVEAGLARAKAVLENPNSSQEEVNAQVQVMKTLTEEVNKALAGGLTSPAELGEGSGATLSEPSPTPRRGRGRRGQLTPPATPAPAENQETKETAEEATDYTNGPGSYPLSENIHKLLQELKTSTENPEQVQKLKEAYDKLNEALQTKEDGVVDQEVFNAALEEYKKASQLKKGAEGTRSSRSRRSTSNTVSGLVYGLATGRPGHERRWTNSDGSGRDSVALLNGSDLNDAPMKFIATVENGGIREFTLTGFPDTVGGKKWATITTTYSNDRKRALITVRGKTPSNIYGLYNVNLNVTLNSGNEQSRIQQVRYQLPRAEFDLSPLGTGRTAQQDVEGKAKAKGNDRPVLQVKVPLPPNGRIDSTNIPPKGQLRVFLVRGGRNETFGGTATNAEDYDIVAWALIGEKGTGYITPPQYLKESIGDQTLRLVTAYVQQNTNNPISSDFVSPLSNESIRPTNPVDRDGAKNAVTQAKNDADQAVDRNNNLSETEKKAAKAAIKSKADEATRQIDQAQDQGGVDQAKQEGLSNIDLVLDQAFDRANGRRQSNQDKDQTPPPSATRNRRTPPRRARRSVGFVGNSQTGTTPSAVDKSELQSLVEELERRLQDIAGLSPEALEEAQRILREAQAALANENLTAQELADLLAKVRQALNSLQIGISADKSQSASNSNKEVGSAKEPTNATDVPLYGVFGAAVLSLLGALLFALARKKNSQLDKLLRELNQLLVELEASDKDKKGLGKAKKLAKKARTFVDSQQKDPQKEAELISEIKTVLSQLKEEV